MLLWVGNGAEMSITAQGRTQAFVLESLGKIGKSSGGKEEQGREKEESGGDEIDRTSVETLLERLEERAGK